jgi:hypothetical protein
MRWFARCIKYPIYVRSVSSLTGRLDHCFQIMSGGLVATDLNQVMPLGLIRDCLRFAGERALSRSSRQGR